MEGSYIPFDCQSGRIPWAELGQRTCTLRDPCIADLPGATFLFQLIDPLANPAGITHLAWDAVFEVFPEQLFQFMVAD